MASFRFPQLSPEQKAKIQRANRRRACYECARLKLRCDRKLPTCSSCIRRSVAFLCPNGPDQITNLPEPVTPANVAQTSLTLRIQELEDALAIFQLTHPLLRGELLQIKYMPSPPAPAPVVERAPTSTADLSDAFGTLTIGKNGDAQYFGPSGGHESILQAGMESLALSSDIDEKCQNLASQRRFSFESLIFGLPEKNRAWTLMETYLEQGQWGGEYIDREELVNDLLTPIYNFRMQYDLHEKDAPFSPHRLALLFFVFTIGALVDLTLPPDSDEADHYFQLGRAALSLQSVYTSPELTTVQALALLSHCHLQGSRHYSLDAAWSFISAAAKRAQSIGLHRESPPQWKLDAITVKRRRFLFWETYTTDAFLSLSLGRPPSIRLSYTDCQFPEDEESIIDENGQTQPGPDRWRWMLSKQVLDTIVEQTLTAEQPTYATILELDRLLRDFNPPSYLRHCLPNASDLVDGESPRLYMKKNVITQLRASIGLYVHCRHFAKTVLHFSDDPMGSPYCLSFLAAYRGASLIIAINVKHFTIPHLANLLMRHWPMWGALFSAAMVVGSIVIRCPGSSLASKAYMDLGLAVAIFERGAEQSTRARSGLITLRRVMDRATKIFSPHQTSEPLQAQVDKSDYFGDEMEMLAGYTKVLVSKFLSSRHPVTESLGGKSAYVPQHSNSAELYFPPQLCSTTEDTDDSPLVTYFPQASDLMSDWLMDQSAAKEVAFSSTDEQPALTAEWLSFMQESGFLEQQEL